MNQRLVKRARTVLESFFAAKISNSKIYNDSFSCLLRLRSKILVYLQHLRTVNPAKLVNDAFEPFNSNRLYKAALVERSATQGPTLTIAGPFTKRIARDPVWVVIRITKN